MLSFFLNFISAKTIVENGEDYHPELPEIPFEVTNSLGSDFYFGYASSAAQVEGAIDKDGKSPSIWDVFSKVKGKTADGTNTATTVDEYDNYQSTIDLLKMGGANSYRMSIAWTRLVPGGVKGSPINQLAVDHYNKFFDALISNGITPFVSLYHWDMPQILDDQYKSLLNTDRWTEDFLYYADAAFQNFGDKIKFWATYNEPATVCLGSYGAGLHPPNRCLNPFKCLKLGFSPLDVFRCGHSVLISHAKAVDLYRKKYQPTQHGKISIVNIMEWSEPMTQDPEDIEAAQIRNDLGFGWWVDPVYTGDYPESMKAKLWILLPKFTEEDKKLLKGSTDYFGLNHYTTQMTARPSFKRFNTSDGMPSTPLSRFVSQHYDVNGTLIGDPSATFWLFDVPWGLKHTLQYIKRKYDNPDIYITENGYPVIDEYKKEFKDRTHDPKRIKYYAGYLNAMQEAIKESGVKVKSYFAWTLMDNFEWQEGFTVPFGTTSFDRSNNKRYLKDSFYYLRDYFTKAIQK